MPGRYDEALKNYQQALVIMRGVGSRADEGKTLDNIGGVYILFRGDILKRWRPTNRHWL